MLERQVTLREANTEDTRFLERLFYDARRREVAMWEWQPEQEDNFLRMQFDAQRRSYQAAFPDAQDSIVYLDDTMAGHVLVEKKWSEMRLIDISLLEEHRNRGLGTELLRQLQRECEIAGLTLRLQVMQGNPAIHLYQRMGFVQSCADPMYIAMEWFPTRPLEGF
jgi:ribosomal protein S18 acetylase RimI-like enzyme